MHFWSERRSLTPPEFYMSNVQQQTRNNRIKKYLPLVYPIATHYAHRSGFDRDDLVQVGCFGLIQASQRFDKTKGRPFQVFARPHIRGAILHYLRDGVSLVRLPRCIEERAIKIRATDEQSLNPSDQLIQQEYRFKSKWVELKEEQIETQQNCWSEIERRESSSSINKAFFELNPKDQKCIQLVILEGLSLRVAGRKMGISAMTVQRSVKRALRQLSGSLKQIQSD